MPKTRLDIGERRVKIFGSYPKDMVDDAISAKVPGFMFSPRFKMRTKTGQRLWDGKVRLLARATDTFPVGVLDIVCSILDLEKVNYELDYTKYNAFKSLVPASVKVGLETGFQIMDKAGPFTLRKYQKEAIDSFLNNTDTLLPYRGIFKIPTAAGKTLIAACIARTLKIPTLFLVHGKNLSKQNHEVFRTIFDGCLKLIGFIDAKNWNPNLITIASIDTLYARYKKDDPLVQPFLNSIQFVIADEVHRATSKGWTNIIRETKAPFRLGLSGTPIKKEDDRDLLLCSLIGPVMYSLAVPELQEQNFISNATLTCVFVNKPKIDSFLYHDAISALIIHNEQRNKLIAKLVIKKMEEGKTGMVLAGNSIALAANIFRLLEKKYSNDVRLVYGETADDYTTESFELLRQKKLKFLVTTTIADEGLDIPEINALLLVGGGASFVRTIQRVGRGLRIKADGGILEVIDFMDLTNPYLTTHANRRLDYYAEEGIFQSINALDAEVLEEELGEERDRKGLVAAG